VPDDIEKALQTYCGMRNMRTARVQLQSRAIGDHIYHPSGMHAALRNAMLRSRSDEQHYDSLQWLYGGTGLGDGKSAGQFL
jgi:salicylate hydroxylase